MSIRAGGVLIVFAAFALCGGCTRSHAPAPSVQSDAPTLQQIAVIEFSLDELDAKAGCLRWSLRNRGPRCQASVLDVNQLPKAIRFINRSTGEATKLAQVDFPDESYTDPAEYARGETLYTGLPSEFRRCIEGSHAFVTGAGVRALFRPGDRVTWNIEALLKSPAMDAYVGKLGPPIGCVIGSGEVVAK
jgi:hypothetical protein